LLYVDSYDLYFITETWLHDGVCSGLLDPDSDFNILRKDRTVMRGGVVCVMAKKHLRVMPVSLADEFCSLEMLCFDLIVTNSKLRFFLLYRPPPLDAEAVSYMRLLVQCLSRYESNKYPSVIVGDLNLPKINWHTCTGFDNDVYMLFLSYVIESSYIQLVDFPTRDANILDVILTSDESLITAIESDLPVGTVTIYL